MGDQVSKEVRCTYSSIRWLLGGRGWKKLTSFMPPVGIVALGDGVILHLIECRHHDTTVEITGSEEQIDEIIDMLNAEDNDYWEAQYSDMLACTNRHLGDIKKAVESIQFRIGTMQREMEMLSRLRPNKEKEVL